MAKLWLIYAGCILSLVGGVSIGIGLSAHELMDWLMTYSPNGSVLVVLGVIAFILGIISVYLAKPSKTPQ